MSLESRIRDIYKQASEELTEKVDSYFATFERLDRQKQAQVKAGKLTQEEYEKWRRNKILRGEDFQALRDNITARMLDANRIAASYINGELPPAYTKGFNRTGQDAEKEIPGYSFSMISEYAVRRLSTDDKTLLPYKYVDGRKDVRWNTKKVNAAVLQGIIQGEPSKSIAKRLMHVTDMNEASAIRNARTALTGALNHGRQDGMKQLQDDGVIVEKKWFASPGDGRTRDWHAELHGVSVPVDKPFTNEKGQIMYPGDPNADPANVYNCRCSIATKIMGFAQRKEETIDEPSEADIKEREYQDLKREREELKDRQLQINEEMYGEHSIDEDRERMRLSRLKDSLSKDYSKYDQFKTKEEFDAFRKEQTDQIGRMYDELEKMRANKPRYRDYDGNDTQFEKDIEKFRTEYEELQEKIKELEKRLYYQSNKTWKDIELQREAKAMGLDKIEQRLAEINNANESRRNRLAQISDRVREIDKKIDDDYVIQTTIEKLKDKNVEFREPTKRKLESLIEPLAGGDMTEGSCASLAMCYSARKQGYDVLDFRDGNSRQIIAENSRNINKYFIRKYGAGAVESAESSTTAGHKVLSHAQVGKEYYLSCAHHASIVRKREDGWVEYLELQSGRENGNGWHPLGNTNSLIDEMLKWRFGASKNEQGYTYEAALLDIDALRKDSEFARLIGYINTAKDAQKKGEWGHEK